MKYSGKIGITTQIEDPNMPGIWINVIREYSVRGDLRQSRISRQPQGMSGPVFNDFIRPSNTISIVANTFIRYNWMQAVYITWMNQRWKITDVELAFPRLNLTIGEIWNGEEPIIADQGVNTN